MNIVITGANGFIGKNLSLFLKEQEIHNIYQITTDTSDADFNDALMAADFVFHLAGVNRSKNDEDFNTGNVELTSRIVSILKSTGRKIPLMFSSSSQAEIDNVYGQSKAKAEKIVESYGHETGSTFYIYRFPNVFGKWCLPNYNSVVATFCFNILNDIEINVHNPNSKLTLVYIDDLCRSLIDLLNSDTKAGFKKVSNEYFTTVGHIADVLNSFKDSRNSLVTQNVGTGLDRALYSTYLSYMTPNQFSYQIPKYEDERGIFCEVLKTKDAGQFSFFTAHPGITRGGHYHHTKNEKFLVISGEALFRFENIISAEKFELQTSGKELEIVETVPGWSHDITNIGDIELVVMLWANEIFDSNSPDTIAKSLHEKQKEF